jgi:predicted membrane protein
MFKFLTKQFLYGRLYLWLKERIGGILFLVVALFLIIYFHNEYLNYVEYKTKFEESYIGISFIIKNLLILSVAVVYFYFYYSLNNTKISKKPINTSSVQTQSEEKSVKESNKQDMVTSLDEFLEDEELK